MIWERMKRGWCAALAVCCVAIAGLPAAALAQQAPASQRAYLGAELRDPAHQDAAAPGRQTPRGAAVTTVEAHSPAAAAGLKPGDFVVAIGGQPVANAAQFHTLIAGKAPGTVVMLRVLRQGRLREGPVKLGVKPEGQAAALAKPEPAAAPVPAASPVTAAAEHVIHPAADGTVAQDKLPVEIVPQLGHSGLGARVAFSPDGSFALSGGDDKTLILWDIATGKELRTFRGHAGVVSWVAFSPDGRSALSSSLDNTLKLWDTTTGRTLRTFTGHSRPVRSVAFSLDGRFALSGSNDKTLKLWDTATGQELRTFTGHAGRVHSVAFSPDGRFALSGSKDKTLKLWDTATGQEVRAFTGHAGEIESVAFSPDGRFALSGSRDHTLKLWDVSSGQELRSFTGHSGGVASVVFSPDGRTVLSGSDDKTLKLWDAATGQELLSFTGHSGGVSSVAFSPDGRTALSSSSDNTLKLWDTAAAQALQTFTGHSSPVMSVAFSPDGRTALAGGDKTMQLWDTVTGQALRAFTGHAGEIESVAFSPDGRTALSGGGDNTLKLWDTATGQALHTFTGHSGGVSSVAFSPDGRFALSGSRDHTLKLWDVASGQELRSFTGHSGGVSSVAFSPDGRTALSGSDDKTLKLWDVATGQELRTFIGHSALITSVAFSPDGRTAFSGSVDDPLKLWDTATGQELRTFTGYSGWVMSVTFSPDGRTALSGNGDHTLKLWDTATGQELRTFTGHSWAVVVTFSPDGRTALSGSGDGSVRIWDVEKGQELARMMALPDGEWLTITPAGFFSSSHRDTDMLAIVRGVEATTIGQVHQSLFNPDLVREALAGDPDGEVRRAAQVVNLEKVLDAGPSPAANITSHAPRGRSAPDLVTVTARITDRGKGVGRIEWRVNGVTAGVISAPAGPGPDYDVKQELALDPGENQIEVIAYEKRNILASLPARTTIIYDGPADTVKPKLYILAVGVNAYVDQGWTPPGGSDKLAFPPLNLAVADATAFGAEMQEAGAGQYGEVRVVQALDTDATPGKLDKFIERMAAEISPRDTFVLYAAAHGYSLGGRYYMIPQDYQGGINPEALESRAISQERLQDWIANRIKAKKALILLDTCESGALVGGYTKSRTEVPASEAAIGRLHEATGRPVLTAAATGKPAFEGYKGHGVFTYALMEALHTGDANNNGRIEITELAAHVAKRVPELAAEVDKHGVVKGVAVAAMRGASGDKQSAHFGSTGEDFAVVGRLP